MMHVSATSLHDARPALKLQMPLEPPSFEDGPGLSILQAAVLVAALHVALVMWAFSAPAEKAVPLAEGPAAVMIDLAPIAVSAKSEVDNMTTGPASVASRPVEPPPEDAQEPDAEPLPKLDLAPPPPEVKPVAELPPPPETKAEPRRADVRKPDPATKPKPKPKTPDLQPRKPAVAARDQGGPRSDVGQAPVAAAATTGSEANQASVASWRDQVRSRIVRNKRFPSEARALGQTGMVTVGITIGPSGELLSARLTRPSGSKSLDEEAVDVMRRSAPFPAPPGNQSTTLQIPISFDRR